MLSNTALKWRGTAALQLQVARRDVLSFWNWKWDWTGQYEVVPIHPRHPHSIFFGSVRRLGSFLHSSLVHACLSRALSTYFIVCFTSPQLILFCSFKLHRLHWKQTFFLNGWKQIEMSHNQNQSFCVLLYYPSFFARVLWGSKHYPISIHISITNIMCNALIKQKTKILEWRYATYGQ
jgi:hypothetical protein